METYRRTLDSSVSNSILKRIPTETRVWYTALTYLARGMMNSDGLALNEKVMRLQVKNKTKRDKNCSQDLEIDNAPPLLN